MSLDNTTIKELLTKVAHGTETTIEVAKELEGGGKKLVVSHRKLLPEEPRAPKRAESPPRTHTFLSARSLADYLARYGERTTVVFADPEEGKIHAVLDEEAGAGFECLVMAPQVHPLWAPWETNCGEWHDVRELARFFLENRRAIVEPDGREVAMTFSQIRASVSVEAMVGRGKGSVNGLVVRTSVQSGNEQSSTVELPETIKLRVPLYVDTDPKEVEIDLCVSADASGKCSVLLSSGTVADARVKAFEDMVRTIREGIKDLGAVLTFGRPSWESWSYLREQGDSDGTIRQAR